MAKLYGADKLIFLHPMFAPAVKYLLDSVDFRVTITSGFRSIDDQRRVCAQLKERGARDGRHYPCATPGLSAHQYGLAVDLMGGSSFSSPEHAALVARGRALGFGFVAADPPHFEHPQWRQLLPFVRRHLGI